jgi:hypothetical protein
VADLFGSGTAERQPIAHEEELRSLRRAPEDVKQAALEDRLEWAKGILPEDEVREALEMDDEEAAPGLAREIAAMKRRNPTEWKMLLASMPKEDQKMLREIERRFGV